MTNEGYNQCEEFGQFVAVRPKDCPAVQNFYTDHTMFVLQKPERGPLALTIISIKQKIVQDLDAG